MDWLQKQKEGFRNSILRDLAPDLSRYVANGKTEAERAERASIVKNKVTPALIEMIDQNGDPVLKKAADYVNAVADEPSRQQRINAVLPRMENALKQLSAQIIENVRESQIPKDAQQTVNYAASIETHATRVFARYDFSSGNINKDAVLEEIRIGALQQVLSEGGDEDEFNVAWHASHGGLSTRFDAALKMPPKRDITTIPPVTEVALTEHSNGIFSLPQPPPDSIYIIFAKNGFLVKYPAGKWGDALSQAYKDVIKPAFREAQEFANIADDPNTKLKGKKIYSVYNPDQKYSALNDNWNKKTPSDISLDRIFVASSKIVETLKRNLRDVKIYEFGTYLSPLGRVPKFGEYEVLEAPDVATAGVAENSTVREASIANRFLLLPEAQRISVAEAFIDKFQKARNITMSAYQKNVAMWLLTGTGNAFVEAVAGSGKSTTLLWCAELIKDFGGRQILLAFNKSIAKKNSESLSRKGASGGRITNMASRTVHSFGYGGCIDLETDEIHGSGAEKELRRKGRNIIPFGIVDFLKTKDPDVDNDKYSNIMKKRLQEILGIDLQKLRNIIDQEMAPKEERQVAQEQVKMFNALLESVENSFKIITSTLVDLNNPELVASTLDYYAIDIGGRPIEDIIKITKSVLEIGYRDMIDEKKISLGDLIRWAAIGVVPMPRMDIIFVDEAQDLSTEYIAFIRNIAARGARLVFVGDRAQAIYGWRGADTTAVENIVREFNCTLLPLSICYRCPVKVVELAQEDVPHIEYRPGAPEGEVVYTDDKQFDEYIASAEPPKPGDMILCRNNAPISRIIMKILKRRIPAVVLGDFFLAYGISNVLTESVNFRENMNFEQDYPEVLDGYMTAKIAEINTKSRNAQSATKKVEDLTDYVDFLKNVFLGLKELDKPAKTPLELKLFIFGKDAKKTPLEKKQFDEGNYTVAEVPLIFTQTDGREFPDDLRKKYVIGSSIHKAKGDEADNVFWFGPDEYDKRKATTYDAEGKPIELREWQVIEEKNLCYVAKTRAKKRLVLIQDTRKAAKIAASAAMAAERKNTGSQDEDFESQDIEDALKDPNLTVTHAGNISTSPLGKLLKPPQPPDSTEREENPRYYRRPNRTVNIPAIVEKGRRLPAADPDVVQFALREIANLDATNITQFDNSIPLLSAFIYLLDNRFISMSEVGTARLTALGRAEIRQMDKIDIDNYLGTDLV